MRLSFADGLFWTSVACCAFAQYFILRSVGGRRHVTEPSSSTMPRPRGMMEILWAMVPAIALTVLLVFTWRAMHPAAEPSSGAPALVTELAP
jgi:heme/copper-type cytochrome/quinol oxidase subunit 2